MRHDGSMTIGILTSGGDCPGLNAVIRGVVLKGIQIYQREFVGFKDGWRGVVEGNAVPLVRRDIQGIGKQGGTILGTSRTNPFEGDENGDRVKETMERLGVDALIAIGGEGTLAAAKRLTDGGVKIVGVPKTIDNDLSATDYTFGFDTAVQIATEAMDRLRTTGDSHGRCMIAEVMGRHVGWIALHSGMAAGAHVILIPEQKTSMEQITRVGAVGQEPRSCAAGRGRRGLQARLDGRRALRARAGCLRPAAAGRHRGGARRDDRGAHRHRDPGDDARPHPARRHSHRLRPGAGHPLRARGHRSVVHERWGRMVSLSGTTITHVAFEDALGRLNSVPQSRYDEAAILFG